MIYLQIEQNERIPTSLYTNDDFISKYLNVPLQNHNAVPLYFIHNNVTANAAPVESGVSSCCDVQTTLLVTPQHGISLGSQGKPQILEVTIRFWMEILENSVCVVSEGKRFYSTVSASPDRRRANCSYQC